MEDSEKLVHQIAILLDQQQKLYETIQKHNKTIEYNAAEQLKAIQSIRLAVAIIGLLALLYMISLLFDYISPIL